MKHLKSTRIMNRKAKPVERTDTRKGIEVSAIAMTQPQSVVIQPLLSLVVTIARAVRLMLAGWMPTELGLWMKRTKWDGGSITETYNLATAYQKQFEPGRTNPNQ